MAKGFAPSLQRPVLPEVRYHVAPRVGPTRAEQRIRAEICEGTFRPPDADQATIEEAYALFVPFWRIDLHRLDRGLRFGSLRTGNLDIPIPQKHLSEAHAIWMVCARSVFPYEMKHPATLLPGDAKPLTVNPAALAQGEPSLRGGFELLDADVDEERAKAHAAASLRSHAGEADGLFSESEHTLRAIHFVRYPIWFARYRYRGKAAPEGDDLFYVGISAVDETPITALHPSKLRSGAAKIKKFFRFDD